MGWLGEGLVGRWIGLEMDCFVMDWLGDGLVRAKRSFAWEVGWLGDGSFGRGDGWEMDWLGGGLFWRWIGLETDCLGDGLAWRWTVFVMDWLGGGLIRTNRRWVGLELGDALGEWLFAKGIGSEISWFGINAGWEMSRLEMG